VLGGVFPSDAGPSGQLPDGQFAGGVENAEEAQAGRIAEEREAVGGLFDEGFGDHRREEYAKVLMYAISYI